MDSTRPLKLCCGIWHQDVYRHLKIHTDLMPLKEESQDLNQMEKKDQYKTLHYAITEEKSFSCSETEKTSSQKRAQKRGTIGNFTCQLCGLRFNKHGNLEVHMRVHTGRKFYPCQHCGVIFNQQGNLKVHMRIHTGEKPYTCQECGKSFSTQGNLKVHMRVHTGESPFTCQQCGLRFTQKGNLKKHINVHSGKKPFTCQQCGKSFNQDGNLKVHMRRIHSGEK
ncbi:zinc finger protein 239-like isoform X2 [Chanodichthys erythropterus]|uniref:zinc finger protein 239-like isoform X2 n=1 Tax=Chanodichthys erythropterus TaxID=933992 RepID=UPI00351DE01C